MIDWDSVFARICRLTGWTWDETESQLDLHRLSALNREWDRLPPVDGLVAAYLGFEGGSAGTEADPPLDQEQSNAAFEQLFAAAGGRVS